MTQREIERHQLVLTHTVTDKNDDIKYLRHNDAGHATSHGTIQGADCGSVHNKEATHCINTNFKTANTF